jgi:hypothetical protein
VAALSSLRSQSATHDDLLQEHLSGLLAMARLNQSLHRVSDGCVIEILQQAVRRE